VTALEAVAPAEPRWSRAVLMGDPTHFSVKGGANPHTRTRFGTRRRVNRERAVQQWHRLRDVLLDLGARILVVPPDPEQPGLVYPANAGFLTDVDAQTPFAQKRFYLSNLIETRAGERLHYERALRATGFPVAAIPHRYRFEGEADFFPVGDFYVLTSGRLERQRFVARLGFPPWQRVYGFRTDARVEEMLRSVVAPIAIVQVELILEAHYHGDTAICAFGPERRHLMVYPRALAPEGWKRLRKAFGEAIVELAEPDAARYAANSFTLSQDSDSVLVMPEGVSERLRAAVRERGVAPICVDVSEFLKKGGGSVKCMIGDLGPVPDEFPLGPYEFLRRSGRADRAAPAVTASRAVGGPSQVADRASAQPALSVSMPWPQVSGSRLRNVVPSGDFQIWKPV
jgi:N-dimethylarginine dimethylaminohydrolase